MLRVIIVAALPVVALVAAAACIGVGGSKMHPGLGWLMVGAIIYVELKTSGRGQ